jgi:hypothetical protein
MHHGKRLYLQEYQPPGPDGLGAKFIFSRLVERQPFITPADRTVRFIGMGLNATFKVADMMSNGVLEYQEPIRIAVIRSCKPQTRIAGRIAKTIFLTTRRILITVASGNIHFF